VTEQERRPRLGGYRHTIEELEDMDGGCAAWYFAKGHVKPARFIACLRRQHGVQARPQDVEHLWAHFIPVRSSSFAGRYEMSSQERHGGGWFPATQIDADLTV
jgi:hypothetical protein